MNSKLHNYIDMILKPFNALDNDFSHPSFKGWYNESKQSGKQVLKEDNFI